MTEEPDIEIVSRWVQDFVDRLGEGWPDELESAINRLRHVCRQRDVAILDGTKILMQCGDAKTLAEDEKRHRTYYQSIVYDVCNLLDCGDLKTVCGTCEAPSRGVQEALSNVLESSHSLYVEARKERDIEIERNDRLATESVKLAAHLHLVRNALRGIAVALKDGEPSIGKPFRMTPQEAVVSRDILIEHARAILSEADSKWQLKVKA